MQEFSRMVFCMVEPGKIPFIFYDNQKEDIILLYIGGHSIPQISAQLGLSYLLLLSGAQETLNCLILLKGSRGLPQSVKET